MQPLDICGLKMRMQMELEGRRCLSGQFSYARDRGGVEALYGLTGAVNILAALGLPMGDRSEAARRILVWRRGDGTFDGGSGPGHAVHMIAAALNLLGEPVPGDIAPLAPTDPAVLPDWLDRHDWHSTHKELCGQTIPLLASGRVGGEWIAVLVREVCGRLSPERPLEFWCAADDPPWRVISCVFHVLSVFDTGRIPYPEPEAILHRLLDLHWEAVSAEDKRTCCTDGDWAWLLLRLCEQCPSYFERCMQVIRQVSARRVQAWNYDPEHLLKDDTHSLYCHLWSTAVFQSCVRDHYTGGLVCDTFNQPALYRL